MPRHAGHTDFAGKFAELLPSPQDLEARSSGFWEQMEVNSERVLEDAKDAEFLAGRFSSLGAGGLQVLCTWAGLDPRQTRADLTSALADYLVENLDHSGCQTVVLLNEFLYRRRADAIEAACRLLVPRERFEMVRSSRISVNSKRFCHTVLAYLKLPSHLGVLMLYEKAERAGYIRYVLVPRREIAGAAVDKESVTLAQEHIKAGADIQALEVAQVDDILDGYEKRYGHKKSLCFDIFKDTEDEMSEVFIFRDLRESLIREVDGVVFGDEAELIVLRLYDKIRHMEGHASTDIGVSLANAIARALLEDVNVHYIEDQELTEQKDLQTLVDALAGNKDVRLRLRELYLDGAPIEGAPILILRCEKDKSLSTPLDDFQTKDIDLLQELHNIRNLKIGFAVPSEEDEDKEDVYSFTVYCQRVRSMRYYVPYKAANIATDVRSQFEKYVREKFNVRVVPGTG